ncbi:SUKH-3 domain-containing protein [Streptomyces sp. NPDC059629]|uniref:SUKH-3 domain-containing protein n=1 Tax=Streptomyces sp. NPDC059629 TaxID=3346889 RepID=UPI0036B0960A
MGLLGLPDKDADLINFMEGIGWFPGRHIDLQDDLDAWSNDGYTVAGSVREFMEECGGLQFEYHRHPAVGGKYVCLVSGVSSVQQVARSLVTEYEERLGRELCPIGYSASGNLFLYMAPDGATYGGHDRFLAKVAGDGYHALQVIARRVNLSPI